MVYNLLAAILLICATGIMMGMDRFWGVEWVENAHEFFANYTLICVGFHVIGVVIESRWSGVPLVRAMITGRKTIPD